jgi:hypothetical protein
LATAKLLWRKDMPFHGLFVRSVTFSPDGGFVLVARHDTQYLTTRGDRAVGTLHLFCAASGQEDPRFAKVNDWIRFAGFLPAGKSVFGVTGEGIKFWNLASGKTRFILQK